MPSQSQPKTRRSTARTAGYVLLGAGVLVAGGLAFSLSDSPPPKPSRKKSKKKLQKELARGPWPIAKSIDETNKPPGERDTPRAEPAILSGKVATVNQALEFIGEDLATRAIRDGLPVVYVVQSEKDRASGLPSMPFDDVFTHKDLLIEHAMRRLRAGAEQHTAVVTAVQWPERQALVGAIYQQPNGIWTATMPTADMIYQTPSSVDPALIFDEVEAMIAGVVQPAATTELTPEQARLVREGSSVAQAVEQTAGQS